LENPIDLTSLIANFKDKNCFITGHTGFKGSWLVHLLRTLGANCYGYALNPTPNSHFLTSNTSSLTSSTFGDIRDRPRLLAAMSEAQPDFVFHLAAQPYVRESYLTPHETFEVNCMGSANFLEASLNCKTRPVTSIITSDKCYENTEKNYRYKETDKLGGWDPYSASKACAEILSHSFRRSFFVQRDQPLVSLRGGNVIGGGDWGQDRLFPDIVLSASNGSEITLRNPNAVRPWQFILDVLSGYLAAAVYAKSTRGLEISAFNIGPTIDNICTVAELTSMATIEWGSSVKHHQKQNETELHEASLLSLDISLALQKLDWAPRYNLVEAVRQTVLWYKQAATGADMKEYTRKQINQFLGINA